MRQWIGGLLVAAVLVLAGGCTTSLKKGASFVLGPTESGEWMGHDCWNQRDAKDGGEKAGPATPRTKGE